jgi:hypothetical protein
VNTHSGRAGLDDLARAGFQVHPARGDHDHIGHRSAATARIEVLTTDAEPIITVSIGQATSSRILPLTEAMATGMVDQLHAQGLHANEHERHTLANLLSRCAALWVHKSLSQLRLSPVTIASGGYCVEDATLTYTHHPAKITEVT